MWIYALDDSGFKTINDSVQNTPSVIGNTLSIQSVPLNTTADCVKALNTATGHKNWKRVYKKKYKGQYAENEYRVFEDKTSGKCVTIFEDDFNDLVCVLDFNLKDYISEIDAISTFVHNHYLDVDCGEMFYDPVAKTLFATGSDCGLMYIDNMTSLKGMEEEEFEEAFEENDEALESASLKDNLPFIEKFLIGDEFCPEAQHGMIFIAQARTPDQVGVKSDW